MRIPGTHRGIPLATVVAVARHDTDGKIAKRKRPPRRAFPFGGDRGPDPGATDDP